MTDRDFDEPSDFPLRPPLKMVSMPAIEVPMGVVAQDQVQLANAAVASAAATRGTELVSALFEIVSDSDAKPFDRLKAIQILLDAEERILDREERTRARLEKEAEADLRKRAVAALEKMKPQQGVDAAR